MSLVFATTFFFVVFFCFFCFFFWGGGLLRHSAVQTDFEFEISEPLHLTQGSMPGGGARGHNLEHLQKVEFLC